MDEQQQNGGPSAQEADPRQPREVPVLVHPQIVVQELAEVGVDARIRGILKLTTFVDQPENCRVLARHPFPCYVGDELVTAFLEDDRLAEGWHPRTWTFERRVNRICGKNVRASCAVGLGRIQGRAVLARLSR